MPEQLFQPDRFQTFDSEWRNGSGCKVHLSKSELPSGVMIYRLSRHLTTVIDGVIHDTYDCSRQELVGDWGTLGEWRETRCVYGIYYPVANSKTFR